MRKLLLCVMSVVLVLSLGGPALAAPQPAVSDNGGAAGDTCIAGKDLKKAQVIVYPTVAATLPDFASVGIQMEADSTLPGMIILNFDVDSNVATGGSSVLAMPCRGLSTIGECAGPNTTGCDDHPGYDFWLNILLRDNGPQAMTQMCTAGACATRDILCSEGGPDCYVAGVGCSAGDPDCWILGQNCGEDVGGDSCFLMDTPCPDPCNGKGRLRGEWYAGIDFSNTFERGRIEMPLPGETGVDTETCFILPWGRILQSALAQGIITQATFDVAKDSPPKYKLATSHDTFADEDDFFTFSPAFGLDVSDWIPNGALAVADADAGAPGCGGDLNASGSVNVDDSILYLQDLGRSPFNPAKLPCPTCDFGF